MCREHVHQSLRLAADLVAHAEELVGECDHDGCLNLDGVIRDSGLKIGRLAQEVLEELSREEAAGPSLGSAELPS